jgi:hypothetical protein
MALLLVVCAENGLARRRLEELQCVLAATFGDVHRRPRFGRLSAPVRN